MKALRIRIQAGLDGRWYVSHFGSQGHSFARREEAETFAKRWAQANEPSIVVVEVDGKVKDSWTFGEETPGIKSDRR